LARPGGPTSFAGRFSATGFGPWLRAHLEANEVDTRPSITARENASLALVTVDRDGVPAYTFYVDGTADWQWQKGELPVLPLPRTAAVHTGSLAAALEPGRAALEGWLRALHASGQVFISFDPNVRPTLVDDLARYRDQTVRLVALGHLVKVSEEDLHGLYPFEDAMAVAARWAGSGPEVVVVTHGSRGASAVRAAHKPLPRDVSGAEPDVLRRPGAQTVYRPTSPVAVADTVGAGDAFTAGLLAWLAERAGLTVGAVAALDTADLVAWLDFANRVAAITCSRPGADPPRREELPP
jgi:fructokinase